MAQALKASVKLSRTGPNSISRRTFKLQRNQIVHLSDPDEIRKLIADPQFVVEITSGALPQAPTSQPRRHLDEDDVEDDVEGDVEGEDEDEDEDDVEGEDEDEDAPTYSRSDLAAQTKSSLVSLAAEFDVKVDMNMKKPNLVEAVLAAQSKAVETPQATD